MQGLKTILGGCSFAIGLYFFGSDYFTNERAKELIYLNLSKPSEVRNSILSSVSPCVKQKMGADVQQITINSMSHFFRSMIKTESVKKGLLPSDTEIEAVLQTENKTLIREIEQLSLTGQQKYLKDLDMLDRHMDDIVTCVFDTAHAQLFKKEGM